MSRSDTRILARGETSGCGHVWRSAPRRGAGNSARFPRPLQGRNRFCGVTQGYGRNRPCLGLISVALTGRKPCRSPKVHCNITFFQKSAGHERKHVLTSLFSATSMSHRHLGQPPRRPGTARHVGSARSKNIRFCKQAKRGRNMPITRLEMVSSAFHSQAKRGRNAGETRNEIS